MRNREHNLSSIDLVVNSPLPSKRLEFMECPWSQKRSRKANNDNQGKITIYYSGKISLLLLAGIAKYWSLGVGRIFWRSNLDPE